MKGYFTKAETLLWSCSVVLIILSFFIFGNSGYLSLVASLVGVTSLIFCAKGNPTGQALMIVFSLLYGYISLTFRYYGEMITYVGMSLPMAVLSLIEWLRHPYGDSKSEVQVNKPTRRDYTVMWILTALVTLIFYFILKFFNTANLIPSTVSVTTSFLAVFLTFKRSPLYALAYATNDVVLIVLWVLAAFRDSSYISVVVCFIAFFVNDLYGFYNWKRMEKRQRS